MIRLRLLWAAACLLLSGGCAGELAGDESRYRANLEGDAGAATSCPEISAIFTESCGSPSCHGGPTAGAQLDLTSPGLEARLVGIASNCESRPYVDPDAPGESFLMEKLESSTPQCGSTMPYGSRLESDVLECVRAWVEEFSTGAVAAEAEGGVP